MSKEEVPSGPHPQPIRPWWRRPKPLIFISIMVLIIIGLAIGLGVGLTQASRDHRCRWGGNCPSSTTPTYPDAPSSTSTSTPTPAPPAGTGTTINGVWQPENGTTWQIQLQNAPTTPSTDGIDVWDIDLFDNAPETMAHIQSQGSKVICYFSAGSSEDWRDDNDQFNSDDKGSGLDGWDGENWLNIKSDNVRRIMAARLDIAKQKGCNGVDPDNVDGYNNDNGLGLTADDTVNYMHFLADEAHSRGLAIGLKNALEIVPQVVDKMQWSVNEQCLEYDECDKLHVFLDQQKPVFHVEYPKGDDTNTANRIAGDIYNDICGSPSTDGFSTIIKNMDLDSFTELCPVTEPAKRR